MKKLIIILLFIGYSKGNAQSNYFAMPDSNALWSITYVYSGWGHSKRIAVKGDSLYGSHVYKKYYSVNDSNLSTALYTFLAIIRQDTLNKKVYAIKQGTTYERLLYNFNLNLNDSVRVTPLQFGYPGTTGYNSNGYKLKVIQKDSVLINAQYRKRLKLTGYSGGLGPEYWIEGIGSTYGILNAGVSGYFITDVCLPLLLCQKQNGVLNYLASFYSNCNPVDCPTGIGELKINNRELTIYPNPTQGILTVKTENGTKLKIVDMLGQLVKEEDINTADKNKNIDIQNLKNGIYFLQVFDNEKLIGTTKIVKE